MGIETCPAIRLELRMSHRMKAVLLWTFRTYAKGESTEHMKDCFRIAGYAVGLPTLVSVASPLSGVRSQHCHCRRLMRPGRYAVSLKRRQPVVIRCRPA